MAQFKVRLPITDELVITSHKNTMLNYLAIGKTFSSMPIYHGYYWKLKEMDLS
jgi:hypothetical protein